jgi:hypothetical protein
MLRVKVQDHQQALLMLVCFDARHSPVILNFLPTCRRWRSANSQQAARYNSKQRVLLAAHCEPRTSKYLTVNFTPLQVPLNEYEFPVSKLASVQSQLERLVEKNYYLHQSARDAYRSYILAYNSHALKEIFNVHTLDLQV